MEYGEIMALMIFLGIFSFIFGSLIGSFLNVLTLRLPQERRLNGRSQCPNCKKSLKWFELIPFFSYIFLGGHCRSCGKKISSRYPLMEATTGIIFLVLFLVLNPQTGLDWLSFVRAVFIASVLLVVFVIDFEHYLILDRIIWPASIIVLILNIVVDITSGAGNFLGLTLGGLLSAGLGFGCLYLLWFISNGRWIGFGDVKYMVFLGLALVSPLYFVSIFLSFLIGGAVSIFLLLFAKKTLQSKIPFGTFLSLGAFITLLYGHELLVWYLGLIGF